jgi:hypothetical protein
MITCFGVCNAINWDNILDNIDNLGYKFKWVPKRLDEWRTKANTNFHGSYQQEVHDMIDQWQSANMNFNYIHVGEYWIDADDDLLINFADYVNADPLFAYISMIPPGHGIPIHWDVNQNEPHHKTLGNTRRFSCFIEPPKLGHVFMVGDQYLYDQPQGTIWEWSTNRLSHIGMNFGLEKKYLFNFVGVDRKN